MKYLVVSDFHLGKGPYLKDGVENILEDFFEDQRFFEFCRHYSSGEYEYQDVHLVLCGDIFNLIQIDVEGIFSSIIDEERAILSMKAIIKGHPLFFSALKHFTDVPKKRLTIIIGNHDIPLLFEGVQEVIKEEIDQSVCFTETLIENGIHIEHGHRFEAINTVPKGKQFLKGPGGRRILNLPWGTLFCQHVLPVIKKDRPFIDKMRPMNVYIRWLVFHDFFYFCKLTFQVLHYFWKAGSDDLLKHNRNFKTTLKVLGQITIYPRYARKAKKIFKKNPKIHTVVMGHTHLLEWRRFPRNKYYFNTGTWNEIPTLDLGKFAPISKLSYVSLEAKSDGRELLKGSLNIWQGEWRPFREEITV